MLRTFDEVLNKAKDYGPKKMAVASAGAEDVLKAVEAARKEGLTDSILVGDKKEIIQIASKMGIDLANYEIIDKPDKTEAARCAVELVRNKEASILMKGMLGTARILKAILDKEIGLRTDRMLSHVYTLQIKGYDRLLTMTDGAMSISPDLKQKAQIIQNAIYYAHSIGIEKPKVAVVAALELVNPDMPATIDAACLAKMSERGQIVGGIVDGPLGFDKKIEHNSEELSAFHKIIDQYEFRLKIILNFLKEKGIDHSVLDAVVGRGGLLKPIASGTYRVNDKMLEDLRKGVSGEHASNLGGLLAHGIAEKLSIPSYIVDPVVIDEMKPVARISGMPEIPRISILHALNQKAVARKAALDLGKNYEKINFIIAHLGGGISVGVHCKGNIIDVNNALNGEGPFTPERSGGVPVGALVELCFSGKFTKDEIMKKIKGKGGLVAYLNTNDVREVVKRIKQGDKKAKLILEAMAYQVAKEIGAGATVLKGQVDAIILTGGIAYNNEFVNMVKDRVSFISLVMIYPGEEEMLALCDGVLRVLREEEVEKVY